MKKFSIILVALLMACAHKPDTGLADPVKVPELPAYLAKRPESLPQLSDPTMGALVTIGAQDDSKYNDVSIQLNKFITFYQCVQKAVNDKNETELEDCLN